MPIGFLFGTALMLFLTYGPAVLIIIFSKANGPNPIKWAFLSILPPLAAGVVTSVMMLYLMRSNPKLVEISVNILSFIGYAGAWAIFWQFKKKVRAAS